MKHLTPREPRPRRAAVGLLLLLLLLASAATPGARAAEPGALLRENPSRSTERHSAAQLRSPGNRDATRFERQLQVARHESARGAERDLRLARWQAGIVALALVLWVSAHARRGRSRRRLRRVALAALALIAVASYYRFSLTERSRENMHIKDVYHYYIGAKYFGEIGYGGIYECTLAIAKERGHRWVDQLDLVRDLRTMIPETAGKMVERGVRECRGRFSEARWREFGHDLSWFFDRVTGPVWRFMLLDHGYNPSPVWTALASPVASAVSAERLPLLVQLDTLLVLAAIASVGWAFGFEAMCLTAIAWGTGYLWRYTWLGDAFLRQLWFATALIGICCLRRAHDRSAGVLLATSALLRVFPAVFIAGIGLHALQRVWQTRSATSLPGRFAAGVGVGVAALVGASLLASSDGLADYAQFERNTALYREIVAKNMAGLPALFWRVDGTADAHWGRPDASGIGASHLDPRFSRGLQLALALGFALLFWRALRGVLAWEAAAMAFTLIPVLVSPGGYYYEFVLLAAPLTVRRPWNGVWLLAACLAWLINGMLWNSLATQFAGVSIIALLLSGAVIATMLRPASGERDG